MDKKSQKKRLMWVWKIYCVVFLSFAIVKSIKFFSPDSQIHQFFNILIAFDSYLIIKYLLNILQIISMFISVAAIIGYTYNTNIGSKILWKIFIPIKLCLDLSGNSFALINLKSLYYVAPQLTLLVIISAVFTYLPSYIGCFIYAFDKKT